MGRLYNTTPAPVPTQGPAPTPSARPTTGGRLYGGTTPTSTPAPSAALTKTGKPNPETLPGLNLIAGQAGLSKETDRVLKNKGENPKKIFSGGIISDAFDALNLLQHGTAGVIQGKGFKEGVRTRASFTDKDQLGKHGKKGIIAGIALDIATDPLTYVPYFGAAKAATKIKTAITASKAFKAAEHTKAGQAVAKALVYRYGQDPVYKNIAERTIKKTAIGDQNLIELAKPINSLDTKTQQIIANARKAGRLEELPGELLNKAKPAFDELDRLGKEAVEQGLLSAETYKQNVGKYIARLYRKHEVPTVVDKAKGLFAKKPLRIDTQRFMKRSDIPEDVREAMGEILEAGYPTAKALVQLNRAVENAKFFGEVATKWGKEAAEEGFKQLPQTKKLGQLSGKFVPEAIFDDIQEITRPAAQGFAKLGQNLTRGFKYGKVILNPATHARNIMSNFILNNFEGLSPARIDIYGLAAKELKTKGQWYQEAKKVGLGLDNFAAQELKSLLVTPDVGAVKRLGKGFVNTMTNMYQKEEEFAKLAQFIFQRKKGLSPEEAWKVAERATFNYAQVTPFIRKMRESVFGYPFITFTYKVTPRVAQTLATKPTKISNLGKIKQGIEGLSDPEEHARERASEPDWVRDGFYVKLPMKDKYGRSAYFDMTYILPFGDLMSGQFFERGVSRETGLPEGAVPTGLRKLPFLNLVKELGQNQDFFGNKIWRESDPSETQLTDLFRYLTKFYTPTLISEQIPGGYQQDFESGEYRRAEGSLQRIFQKERGGVTEGGAETRTPTQELIRNVGVKIRPLDIGVQERRSESEKKRALETLLQERGVLRRFERTYIPKPKEEETPPPSGGGRVY